MTLRTTRSAIDAALSQQRFYRDTFAGLDRSGVLEAALVYKETTKALGALGMSLSGALEQANIAQGIFRQYQDLGVDRLLRESMFSVGTAAEIARNASTASEALAKALETSGILKSLTGLKDTPAHVAFGYAEQLASAKESWERSLGGYAEAAQQAHSLAAAFAAQQADIFRSFDHLTHSSLIELVKAAQALEIDDWDDAEEIEEVADDELHQRLIAVAASFITKVNRAINPAHWTPSDILAVLLFLYAYYDPPFTEADRESLHNAEVHSQQANQTSQKIMQALDMFNRAEVARQEYLEFVSTLPGAVVVSRAHVREQSVGSANRITTLPAGAPVTIAERKGRWRKVIFRDPLTDDLRDGWVWGDSIQLLDD